MIKLWKDVYATYRGDDESHRLRFAVIIISSVTIAYFGLNPQQNSFPTMSLVISILAGFTFTALFSSHAIATSELPNPKNEDDRRDLKLLKILGSNFSIRSRFFLLIAVIDLVLILFLSIECDISDIKFTFYFIFGFFEGYFNSEIFFSYMIYSIKLIRGFFIAISFVIFFECLYSFYRLSETILAVLNIRTSYLDSHTK